jgi:hypothetical protein
MYRKLVPAKQFKQLFSDYVNSGIAITVAKRGQIVSFSCQSEQIKYVNQDATQYVVSPLSTQEANGVRYEYMLPGEYSRELLTLHFPYWQIPKRYNRTRQSVPNFYCGKFLDRDLVYFDLVSAYHQIYSRLWLDWSEIGTRCKYPFAELANSISDASVGNEPFWKSVRNGIVGNLASNQVCYIKNKQWTYNSTINEYRHYNHMILFFVNSLLTELANIALKFGVVYIATDGYIFPQEAHWQDFINVLDKYRLQFRCINGTGSILRFASYNVTGYNIRGDKTAAATKTFFKMWQSYMNNVITKNDKRKQLLIRLHNRPLRNVTKVNNYSFLDYWSNL